MFDRALNTARLFVLPGRYHREGYTGLLSVVCFYFFVIADFSFYIWTIMVWNQSAFRILSSITYETFKS